MGGWNHGSDEDVDEKQEKGDEEYRLFFKIFFQLMEGDPKSRKLKRE